jgi:PAS domain S-box-containing protein
MDAAIIQNSVTSFMFICVIIVFALVFMRSRFFSAVYEQRPDLTTQIILVFFFGILSVFGSSLGITIYGAAVNVRDLGAMAAGLVCGPYIGIGAGIIGGLFRFAQGGPYMWTGLSAPILSGILGGVMYLANRRQFVSTWIAMLLIGLSETLISCYTLVLVTPPAQFITVVTEVAIPMIIFNVVGMFIFASTVHYTLREWKVRHEVQQLELEVESKRNLNAIMNTIAYPVYVLDREHRFTFVNDSLCRFISKARDEILGQTPGTFFNSDDASFHFRMAEDIFSRKVSREDEVTITMPDGGNTTLISSSAYFPDLTGQEYMVGVIRDVTEQRRIQTALAESEKWYRTLFEHTGAATIIIDEDGIISQINSEFAALTGFSREEIEGRLGWKHFAHPDDLAMVKKYHRQRLVDPISVPTFYTVRMVNRSGDTRTLHAVVAVIPGTRKSIASYIDISEQKRTEDALTHMNRKLNLLSSITRHDIINQILVLKGFLSLLRTKTEDPILLDFIGKSGRAALNIERQIVFTRDYQDMGVKAPAWQNVKGAVVAARGALPAGSITVDAEQADLEVFADPLFEKVFFNLVDNSLRYGGDGMHTIRVRAGESGDCLIITYEDDGVGIEPKDREHLFEQGFGKHTGFGLFLSREILSITGISIHETGTHGEGARFTIRVPKGAYRFPPGD